MELRNRRTGLPGGSRGSRTALMCTEGPAEAETGEARAS